MDDGVIVGKALDCTAFSSTFPNPVSHEISRDAIINLVDDFFQSGIQLVTLDGKADIGKTRIVAQFALKRSSHAISVFIRPNSWFMREPSLLYADIASQMYWALNKREMPDPHVAQETLIRQLSFDLERAAKRSDKLFYFLVDGLEDVADGLSQFAGTLLSILPLEYTNFRFLVSGDAQWIPEHLVPKRTRKSYPVPGLSLEETIAYFDGCSLQRSQVEELYKSCGRGKPGYLASARRLIEGGISPSTLIDQLPHELPGPFEIEWQAAESVGDQLFDMLATLSFDTNPHSITDLASIFGIDASEVRQIFARCSFVELKPNDDSPVAYVSTSFRQFVADKLAGRRDSIWGKLAEYLLTQRHSEKALELLPSYLERAGRSQELLSALNPSSLVQLVERTDSFVLLQRQSEMGLDTSVKLKRLGEALRFSVQLATVADIGTPRFARAELIARLAVGDYGSALSLAQSAALKSHRLRLLAALARFQKERGLTPETTVLEALDRLANQIDVREIADDVVDLASDLMYSRPELAIKLISTAGAGKDRTDDRSMDWAFVRLSVLASINHGSRSEELSKTSIDLRSRITDPVARRFSGAISLVVGNYTPREVIAEVEKLESPGDQLFLLRQWCVHTHSPEDAATIIDYAVHLAIRTTAYSPTAADFRDLAIPLPKIAPEDISPLITAFDIQREAARRLGPTQDYIQLQLLLAEAEAQVSQRHAGERLLQTYYDIRDIPDLELRIVCTGLLVAASPRIDPTGAFEDSADVRNVSESEFMNEIRVLLNSTADHYVITRRVVEAVSRSRPDLAIQIAGELNIQSRRDEALQHLVEHALDAPPREGSYDFLEVVLGQFGDQDTEEQVVEQVLTRFCRMPPELLKTLHPKVSKYLERAGTLLNPVIACEALSSASVILHKIESPYPLVQKTEATLKKRWESIDDPSAQLEAGYDVVVALADFSRETAESYLKAADELKSEQSDLKGSTYFNCLRLAIRAFSGLLPRQLSSGADFERLTLLIERVPARLERIYLWTDLALRCFKHERSDDAKRIVNQKIRPLLEKLREVAQFEWRESLGTAAPAMYEVNSATTIDLLLLLPVDHRDLALERILRFRLTNVPPGDPFRAEVDSHYNLDFAGCLEILKLVELFDADSFVYKHIERVASSAAWRHNRHQIAETQKNEIAQRIRTIASKKFPNPKWIKHEGFAILAEAQASKILKEKMVNWSPMIQRARSLTNDSDRVFVLAYIAQCMHGGLIAEKIALLKEARLVSDKIPSTYDRVERLRLLATVAEDIDMVLARAFLVDAMTIVKTDETEDAPELRRKLVDFAYQIDPELAVSLASSLDNDEARRAARKRIDYQKLKHGLLDSSELDSEVKGREDDYANASWELLAYLNAGRVEAHDVAKTLKFVRIAGDGTLRSAFPVLSWVIENAIVKRAHAEEAKRMVREMFDATVSASEIAAAVVSRAAGRTILAPPTTVVRDQQRIIVGAEQRSVAIDFIEQWLRDNGKEFLKICDPYFGPKDLDILRMVIAAGRHLQVTIVTSMRQQQQEKVEWPADEFYLKYWHKHFSDQPPPVTEIVVVGGRSGDLPVHDRWWLTKGAGLRLGSSFGGIGKARDSEISVLTESEIADRLQITDSYIGRQKREHLGEKLKYQFFGI